MNCLFNFIQQKISTFKRGKTNANDSNLDTIDWVFKKIKRGDN